ncbi:hypothetical protein BS78_05G219100 [Paspalum vaginatum]|nr:hypothetical protein BS78_05G219100 [Paspalum vaginatum]
MAHDAPPTGAETSYRTRAAASAAPPHRRDGRRLINTPIYIRATPTPVSEVGRGIASRAEQSRERRPSRLAERRYLSGGGTMGRGRGVSYGGGQSSLSYLFGGEAAAAAPAKPKPEQAAPQPATAAGTGSERLMKGVPAGVRGSQTNNYFRAQGQNCGNFLTDRPSTKVHAAPGGGSSLDYLFGGGGGK